MIGSGSAFSGLLRGAHMADQANMSQQQMQMQQEQFDMLKKQFQQERMDRAKQDAFKAVWAAEKFGDWNELKQIPQKYNDLFADEEIRRLNEDDIVSYAPDGTPGLNPQTRRNFEQQTGIKLPEDDEEAINYLRRYGGKIKDLRSGVESFVTPTQIAAGFGPGYRMYKHSQDLQEAELLAKLQGKQKEASELDILSNLEAQVVKNGYNSLSPEDQATYRILSTKYKMTEANAKQSLLRGDLYPVVDKLSKGEYVDEADINKAIEVQTLAGLDYKGEDQLAKELGAYGQLARVNNEIQSDLGNETKTGVVNEQLMEAVKLAKPEDFRKMKEDDQIAVLRTVSRNTKAMNALMTVLKEQSGSAVAEEEFLRVLNTMLGGDISKLNVDILSKALDTYTREVGEKVKKYIDAVPKRFVGTKASAYDRWNKARQGTSATPESPIQPASRGGTKSFEQVAEDATLKELEQATKVGKQIGGNILDKGTNFIKDALGINLEKPEGIPDRLWEKASPEQKQALVDRAKRGLKPMVAPGKDLIGGN